MARIRLTDKKVTSLKVTGKTEDGKPRDRQDFMDAVVPQFGVRVTDKGQRTYILADRFPGSTHYTRRQLGEVGAISLAEARAKARRWIELIGQGKDPAHEEARLARENLRQLENSFAQVATDYIANEFVGLDPDKPRQRKLISEARADGKPLAKEALEDFMLFCFSFG